MKKNKKGFTLVELVIVVAVMAVLVAVAIPTITSITSTAEESVLKSNAQTIESILKLAEAKAEVDEVGGAANADYEQALIDAKLGIETGTFYYLSTGDVVTEAPDDATKIVATFTYKNGELNPDDEDPKETTSKTE